MRSPHLACFVDCRAANRLATYIALRVMTSGIETLMARDLVEAHAAISSSQAPFARPDARGSRRGAGSTQFGGRQGGRGRVEGQTIPQKLRRPLRVDILLAEAGHDGLTHPSRSRVSRTLYRPWLAYLSMAKLMHSLVARKVLTPRCLRLTARPFSLPSGGPLSCGRTLPRS